MKPSGSNDWRQEAGQDWLNLSSLLYMYKEISIQEYRSYFMPHSLTDLRLLRGQRAVLAHCFVRVCREAESPITVLFRFILNIKLQRSSKSVKKLKDHSLGIILSTLICETATVKHTEISELAYLRNH